MMNRPHLVIDGAALAAEAVGADEIVFYIGEEHEGSVASMRRAMLERRSEIRRPMRLVEAPIGYIAGEASAAVHCVNDGDARPTTTPPRMSEKGVGGCPTLVQNVESLAMAALIARYATRLVPLGRAARDQGHGARDADRPRARAGRPRGRDRHDGGRAGRGRGRPARRHRGRRPGRLLRDVGAARGGVGPSPRPRRDAGRRADVRVRDRRSPRDRLVRRGRDVGDHRVPRPRERRAVRAVRLWARRGRGGRPQGRRSGPRRRATSRASSAGSARSRVVAPATTRTARCS